MRLAAAAWPMERPRDWDTYAVKLEAWIVDARADLLVFPEYAGMEGALATQPEHDVPQAWVEHAAMTAERVRDLHVTLARRHGVHLLSGSLPVEDAGRMVNRAWLCAPDGGLWHHDKQVPTLWERAHTTLVSGDPLRVSETALGRIGVLICHDSEFPPLGRAVPCDVLCVPACTDGFRGAQRVRTAARARALEGRCHVAMSQTVGDVAGCCFLDVSRGRAGVYGPPDRGFPENGVFVETEPETGAWARATADFDAIARLDVLSEVDIPGDWALAEARARLAGA